MLRESFYSVYVFVVSVKQLFILSVSLYQMNIGSSLLELTLGIYPHFNHKWMIAFQWVRRRLHYVTIQHFYLGTILNSNDGFQRHVLFSRFSVACSRMERDPLSRRHGHHYPNTDRFLHLSWYWLFSICNSYRGHSGRGDVFHAGRVAPINSQQKYVLCVICCIHSHKYSIYNF